jgi:IS6 family transposase
LLRVRWYLRHSLSYRDLEEMMRKRGVHVDHTTIYRWVQRYALELEKRCKPHLKATTDSWWVDETYVKVKKVWIYLYRAVDSPSATPSSSGSSPTRDAQAAKRCFSKTLAAPHSSEPRVITVDKKAASPKAFKELKEEGTMPQACELRQVKYLNNIVEQDHRFIKRCVKSGLGFFSFETTRNTGHRYESMNMLRKGQVHGVEKGNITDQVAFIARLFGVAA